MKRRRQTIKKKPYKFNVVDQFLILFIALLGSLTITKTDTNNMLSINNVRNTITEHINILSLRNVLLGQLDIFQSNKTEEVMHDMTLYQSVSEKEDGLEVQNDATETVTNICDGVVVKKTKTSIVVKGLDGLEYHYSNLNAVNVNLYDYVKVNEILGVSFYNEELDKFTYTIKVKNKGNFISVKDVLGLA